MRPAGARPGRPQPYVCPCL
ncbi:hypothetical protein GT002_00210, partial [Streptomyces sp. SID4917]|nr:hypothetical protein [Streptomyces sp. SID4917]